MIDFDNLNRSDWVAIYERLDDDGELSKAGKAMLKKLRRD
jgi:hypothetical protein